MERIISRPWWVHLGLRRDRRVFHEWTVGGGDTETVKGLPYTLQLYSKERPELRIVRRVNAGSITRVFLEELTRWPDKTTLYFHNLEFDAPVLFFELLDPFFTESRFDIKGEFLGRAFVAEVFFGKINFIRLSFDGKEFLLIDTFAFFKSSLAELSKRFGLPAKMKKPRKLGEVRYQGAEWESFKKYALRDAEVACALGHHIQEFHRLYDVPISMSAPQMSARVFRHRFIPDGEKLTGLPKEFQDAATLSYHGGKNGLYVPPGIYKGVKLYDINSAYPFAMTQLPNFMGCSYEHRSGKARFVCGLYCICGRIRKDRFSVGRSHDFTPLVGAFERIWVTSYELPFIARITEQLRVEESICVRERRSDPNPLGEFARYFYSKKGGERGPLREFYKICLNSLYGKFIQSTANASGPKLTVKMGDKVPSIVEEAQRFVAGGLWNPMIASLITGFTRAQLAGLEEKYHALHSSTDSVMVQQELPTSEELGGLSLKAQGSALLLRPKLYLLWDDSYRLVSFALHGYHGSLRQFVSLMRSGKRKYFHRRLYKLRESRISTKDIQPLTFGEFFKSINLPLEGPIAIPPLTYKLPDGRVIKL